MSQYNNQRKGLTIKKGDELDTSVTYDEEEFANVSSSLPNFKDRFLKLQTVEEGCGFNSVGSQFQSNRVVEVRDSLIGDEELDEWQDTRTN